MYIFKIIFAVFLQITQMKTVMRNDIVNDVDVNALNAPHGEYFIIIKKNDPKTNFNKIKDRMNNFPNGEYYLVHDKNLKVAQRRLRDFKMNREQRKQTELLKTQQERKVKEITEFMKDHPMTTNYLYDEVQRIKRQKQVKDDLREMIEYLEKPGKSDMRSKILKCYSQARKEEIMLTDRWELETNNLVINVLKDPYNYGFIN